MSDTGAEKALRRRISVSAKEFWANPAVVMEQALDREVAVVDTDGGCRLLIIRRVEPLED